MMIEVRRDLYMSEETGERLAEFDAMAARVCRLLEDLVALIATAPPAKKLPLKI